MVKQWQIRPVSRKATGFVPAAEGSHGNRHAQSRRTNLLRSPPVPHKRLWRLTGEDGVETACELEALSTNRVLLTVKRNGEPIVQETFVDKRDALARSVGLYKDLSRKGSRDA